MREQISRSMVAAVWLSASLCLPCAASKVGPDRIKVEIEAQQIEQMAAAGDIDDLVRMLSEGEFPSKESAARYLGEIGDDRALPELRKLNSAHGGWPSGWGPIEEDLSGTFAVAICKIQTRKQPEKAQIEALLDLVDGKGPGVPESIEPAKARINGVLRELPLRLDRNRWVGRQVAAELDRFDDPSVTPRLRRSENEGISSYAVWREVREMETETAIARCMQIARDEGGAQRFGAIHCLARFDREGDDALDQLAREGHGEAITVLGRRADDPNILAVVYWHLANNRSDLVRLHAVGVLAYGKADILQAKSLTALVEALYDPSDHVRRSAASALSIRAYRNNKQYFDQVEDSLLVALKHPDPQVRTLIRAGLERLSCERLDEPVPEPPPFRTDLDEHSPPPSTAEQRLKARVDPLEKEAAAALKWGPAEKAVELYDKLLELKPGFEPYEKARETAKAYVAAAAQATDSWRPDARYIDLKGRYSYVLACTRYDTAHLKEVFTLEADLTQVSGGWVFRSKNRPDMEDLRLKYLRLFEHVIEHYPPNESLVLRAKVDSAMLRHMLYKDTKTYLLRLIDVFSIRAEEIVSSTRERRDTPSPEYEGKTGAAAPHQARKRQYRGSVINSCMSDPQWYYLLDVIIARCANSDPEIVELAKAAKAEIAERERVEAEMRKEWLLRKQNESH